MQLLPRRIEPHLQKNYQRHAFAEEVVIKVQRLGECFAGGTLPPPEAQVIAAWKDVPNTTIDVLPMSMKTGFTFLQAPPPTPTGLAFDMDKDTSSESSFDDIFDNGRMFAEYIRTPSPNTVAYRPLGGSTASEDSISLCKLDQCLEEENVEDLFQSSVSNSPSSSEHESISPRGKTSSTPVGFYNMVNQWFLDYQARGIEAFVEALIAFGVISLATAPLASRIARAVIKKVSRKSYTEGKNLESNLRSSALASFKKCWELSDSWTMSPTPHCVGIASLIGSLFDEKVSTAKDIHLCLSYLLEGEKGLDRLCAMHALLIQANDKLCKSRNFQALMEFRDEITTRDKESGEYLWVTTTLSKAILVDILTTIERWMGSQSRRRELSRRSTGNGTVRSRAVGPRLRGDLSYD